MVFEVRILGVPLGVSRSGTYPSMAGMLHVLRLHPLSSPIRYTPFHTTEHG